MVAEGETVIAKRGAVFVDVLAEDVSQGDVVVVPSGLGTIRAHRILERICSTRPAKMETFIQATAWRGHLTDFVNRKYKDQDNKQWKIVDIYRDIRSKEVPPFDYAALRNWLRSDEPVGTRARKPALALSVDGVGRRVGDKSVRGPQNPPEGPERALY